MQLSTLNSGLPHVDYYAPGFRVEIDGEQLAPATNGDVLSLGVKMDIEQMTSFELTVANTATADRVDTTFKYSDGNHFDIGRQVHVKMGYADRLVSMITGQITSIAPKFPQTGTPTLTVSGQDGLFRLKDRRPDAGETIQYINKTDWEIAEVIAQRNKLQVNVTREGPTHAEVVQRITDDGTFLKERAARIDFDCYVLTDPATSKSTLHFVRPSDGRDGTPVESYALRWGENLISFTPTINLSDQVANVTVRGWDPATKQVIIGQAGPDDLPKQPDRGDSGPSAAARTQQGKQDVVVDAPVTSHQEAFELARSLLLRRAYQFITGSGQIIGRPELRPGHNLTLSGLGRFNGTYYVTRVGHQINGSGYLTSFEARRMYHKESTE
ncbi:MAG: phage late control D family protein [Gammaproteobacteria bacterium]